MRRMRKRDSTALGYLIILGLVISAFGWIKENVVDYTKPEFWTGVGALIAVVVTFRICRAMVKRGDRLREEAARAQDRHEYLAWGVKRAVEIATHQKWVSANRLSTQAHVSVTQAQELIALAVSASLLYQAVNGRYYPAGLIGQTSLPPPVSEL